MNSSIKYLLLLLTGLVFISASDLNAQIKDQPDNPAPIPLIIKAGKKSIEKLPDLKKLKSSSNVEQDTTQNNDKRLRIFDDPGSNSHYAEVKLKDYE